jgi:ABC-type transport system substrate-binding protein
MEYTDLLIIENILDELSIPFKRIIKPDNYYKQILIYKPFLFRVSMTPSFPDPTEYYSLFYSKNSSNVNLSQFKNSEYDKIYEYVQTESESFQRNAHFDKLEEILHEEVAAIYLTHQGPLYYIFSNNMKNLKFSYLIPDFRELYFE